MADYYPLIARALAGLSDKSPAMRAAVYDRARTALDGQLRSLEPRLAEADIAREARALETAIDRAEAEQAAAPPQAAPADPAAFEPAGTFEPPDPEPRRPRVEPAPAIRRGGRRARSLALVAAVLVAAPIAVAAWLWRDRPAPEAQRGTVAPAPATTAPSAGEPKFADRIGAAGTPGGTVAPRSASPAPPRPPAASRPPAPTAPTAPPPSPPPVASAPAPASTPSPASTPAPQSARIEPAPALPFPPPAPPANVPPPAAREAASPIPAASSAPSATPSRPAPAEPSPPSAEPAKPAELLRPADSSRPSEPAKTAESSRAAEPPRPVEPPKPAEPARTADTAKTADAARPAEAPKPVEPVRPAVPGSDMAVAQRAFLIEENPADPPQPKVSAGRALWRLDAVNGGQGQPLETVVRATVDLPEIGLSMRLALRRNLDPALPASHTIELTFTSSGTGGESRAVRDVALPQLKQDEGGRGLALSGLPVPVKENVFLIGLSDLKADIDRNLELLQHRNWVDLPVRFASGQRGAIIFEKGVSGDRVLAEAVRQWSQPPASPQ